MRAFPRAIPAPLRPHPPRRRWTRGTESMSTPLLGAGRPRAHPAYERDQPTRTPHGKNSLERFRPRCPRLTVTAFLRGEVARFVSDVVARQLVDQATLAERQGRDYMVPRLTGDRRLLTAAKWYIAERGDWLSSSSGTKTMAEAMGVPALPPDLVAL